MSDLTFCSCTCQMSYSRKLLMTTAVQPFSIWQVRGNAFAATIIDLTGFAKHIKTRWESRKKDEFFRMSFQRWNDRSHNQPCPVFVQKRLVWTWARRKTLISIAAVTTTDAGATHTGVWTECECVGHLSFGCVIHTTEEGNQKFSLNWIYWDVIIYFVP